MADIDGMMSQLPREFSHEWTSLSAQERLAGNQALQLYATSVLVVFLALTAAALFSQANDVYFKVGLLTTIGLAAKNAILIFAFAIAQHQAGKPLIEATLEVSRQRLRPILMTSFAFILGVLPLAIASGAGPGSRNSIGIGVMGGMISATFLGILFIPVLCFAVRRVFKGRPARDTAVEEASAAHACRMNEHKPAT